MKQLHYTFRKLQLLTIIVPLGILTGGVLFFFQSRSPSLTAYASQVIARCGKAERLQECYDQEIPKLMDRLSMEETFTVTRMVLAQNPSYGYCHVLAHKLSARETRKNLTRWKEVIPRCPTDICNYGCLHGPLLERFGSQYLSREKQEEIKTELADVCMPRANWNPTEMERGMCYHGMGHLHMYLTRADVPASVALCQYLGEKSGAYYIPICLEGVFMQIFQPLEPEDEALIANIVPTKETVKDFCGAFSGIIRDWCWRESLPLFRGDIMEPEGLVSFCSFPATPEGKFSCLVSAVSTVATTLLITEEDPPKLIRYCEALPLDLVDECFSIAAQRLIQTSTAYVEKAVQFCASLPDAHRDKCYGSIAGVGIKVARPHSENLKRFCDNLPAPWNSSCAYSP